MIIDYVKGLEELRERRQNDALNIIEQHEDSITAYKIYSKILDDYIWIAVTEREYQGLVAEGIKEVIYTQEEANKLMANKVSKDGLRAIHKIKKNFPGASIQDISDLFCKEGDSNSL